MQGLHSSRQNNTSTSKVYVFETARYTCS